MEAAQTEHERDAGADPTSAWTSADIDRLLEALA